MGVISTVESTHFVCNERQHEKMFFFLAIYKDFKNRHFPEQVPMQSTVDIIQLYAETNTKMKQ